MKQRSGWWAIVGGLAGGGLAFAIAWALAGDDVDRIGDWRGGALRFIGMVTTVGIVIGYFVVARLTRGAAVTRDGFTLSYRPLDPVPSGYREMTTLAVSDLLERLRIVGYAPTIEACDALGQRAGAGDPAMPLAAANVAISDPLVRGWIRLQLSPSSGQPRALGLVEVWSERGEAAEELGLFTLRVLGELVGGLAASRESSRLGHDPVALLTAGLPDRPRHRG